jgi:hypothetical protein
LVRIEPPHHRLPPQRIASEQPNHCSRKPSTPFATKSAMIHLNETLGAPSARARRSAAIDDDALIQIKGVSIS